ncbi:MAG: glycosidase, partial [Chthonomonadales bacterium]
KSGAILTTKVNGKYWMYYLGTADGADQMGVASSADLKHWQDATKLPVLPKRPGMFDSKVVEPGPAPLLTEDGILLIYNGADDKLVYRTGWVLFDKKDPTKVISRSDKPFFVPEKKWEVEGQVPNVVFVEGLIQNGDKLNLYYGAGDTSTGVMQCKLKK